jgi:DNA-binding response OmpR family regulator
MAKKKTVLIVEDEENIANAQKLILEDHYSIHLASDGEMGLQMIKQLKPDLVILDLMLPNRGGYDICFNMQQDPELSKVKVLMVTALNQSVDRQKGVLVGADSYLTKPFEPSQLLGEVKRLLS